MFLGGPGRDAVAERRTDGYKMLYAFQRPQQQSVQGIGAWYNIFELISLVASQHCKRQAEVEMGTEARSY